MTTPEREAEISRLYFAEHWRVGTIAAQLGVHPDVVRRVLGLGAAGPGAAPRPRLVDPYRAFIAETLARYPRLRATRLHDMLAQRGYAGAVRTLREYVAEVRPKPRREVSRTEPWRSLRGERECRCNRTQVGASREPQCDHRGRVRGSRRRRSLLRLTQSM